MRLMLFHYGLSFFIARIVCIILAGCNELTSDDLNAESKPLRSPRPLVYVASTVIDMGKLQKRPEPLEVVVSIGNHGDAPLHIRQVLTSCGCLRSEMSESMIPARGEAFLKLRMESRNVGPRRASAIILSDCHVNPELGLLVDWYVEDRLATSPEELLGLEIASGDNVDYSVKLIRSSELFNQELSAELYVQKPTPGVSCTVDLTGDECKLHLQTAVDAPSGSLVGSLRLRIAGTEDVLQSVPLRVVVSAPLTVSPKVIWLNAPVSGMHHIQIVVRSHIPDDIRSLRLSWSNAEHLKSNWAVVRQADGLQILECVVQYEEAKALKSLKVSVANGHHELCVPVYMNSDF